MGEDQVMKKAMGRAGARRLADLVYLLTRIKWKRTIFFFILLLLVGSAPQNKPISCGPLKLSYYSSIVGLDPVEDCSFYLSLPASRSSWVSPKNQQNITPS